MTTLMVTMNSIYSSLRWVMGVHIMKPIKDFLHPMWEHPEKRKKSSSSHSLSLSFSFTFSILFFDSFFHIIYQSKIYFISTSLICIIFILVLQHIPWLENSTVPLRYLSKKQFWPLDEDGSIWTVQLAYVFLKNLKIYKKNKSRLSVTWFPASIFLNLV